MSRAANNSTHVMTITRGMVGTSAAAHFYGANVTMRRYGSYGALVKVMLSFHTPIPQPGSYVLGTATANSERPRDLPFRDNNPNVVVGQLLLDKGFELVGLSVSA